MFWRERMRWKLRRCPMTRAFLNATLLSSTTTLEETPMAGQVVDPSPRGAATTDQATAQDGARSHGCRRTRATKAWTRRRADARSPLMSVANDELVSPSPHRWPSGSSPTNGPSGTCLNSIWGYDRFATRVPARASAFCDQKAGGDGDPRPYAGRFSFPDEFAGGRHSRTGKLRRAAQDGHRPAPTRASA
jgi:hypothetical protein